MPAYMQGGLLAFIGGFNLDQVFAALKHLPAVLERAFLGVNGAAGAQGHGVVLGAAAVDARNVDRRASQFLAGEAITLKKVNAWRGLAFGKHLQKGQWRHGLSRHGMGKGDHLQLIDLRLIKHRRMGLACEVVVFADHLFVGLPEDGLKRAVESRAFTNGMS